MISRWRTARSVSSVEWLVVGLGNPGARYAGTRHNVGREVVLATGRAHGIALDHIKHAARFGTGTIGGRRVCLASPTTFMNVSGPPVAALARFFRVAPSAVLLVSDDLDLPVGRIRVRVGGGAGGHNGVTSALAALGTEAVPRLRLGIGRPPEGWDAADYVLARIPTDERAVIEEAVARAVAAVEAIVGDGVPAAMNVYN